MPRRAVDVKPKKTCKATGSTSIADSMEHGPNSGRNYRAYHATDMTANTTVSAKLSRAGAIVRTSHE